ncbi:hypothetical protein D3C71_1772990 [compost metagenome]
MGDIDVAREGLRLEPTVHEDLIGAGLINQTAQLSLGVAPAQNEPPAARAQRGVQRPQRLVQPPRGRRAERAPLAPLVQDEKRQQGPPRRCGGVQGGVVFQSQVAAEPQDDRTRAVIDQGGSPARDAGS